MVKYFRKKIYISIILYVFPFSLIFSAFVAVLNVVEYFFKKISENDPVVLKELSK